ncbi:MAG: N-acetylmuramoyl-L-alanine amidase [Ruegeria sp.]
MFTISDHFVDEAKRISSLGKGSKINPTKLVIHYTAGSTLSSAISALKKHNNSYNLFIDKDGSVHQARALNRRAGHAGRSNWKADSGLKNESSLNGNSVAISLVNLGYHRHYSGGFWWYGEKGGKYKPPKVPDQDANKLSSIYSPRSVIHWDPYTDAQVETCEKLVEAILSVYPSIDEIVGHDDVSINSKFDPGPDLPVQKWREKYGKEGSLGLEAYVDSPDDELNLRDRPVYLGGKVERVLKQGDRVFIRSVSYVGGLSSAALINTSSNRNRALTGWASVDTTGNNTHDGFVYMGYLTKTPLAPNYQKKLLEGAAMF